MNAHERKPTIFLLNFSKNKFTTQAHYSFLRFCSKYKYKERSNHVEATVAKESLRTREISVCAHKKEWKIYAHVRTFSHDETRIKIEK